MNRTPDACQQLALALVLLTACAAGVHAATFYVSPSGSEVNDGTTWALAKQTIQAGINAASSGDVVWVTNGTYALSATITNRTGITLRSLNGAQVTTLDGGDAVRCVYVMAAAVLDGFTVTNGYVGAPNGHGGGVYTVGTVQNCTISGNVASNGMGGGVAMYFGGTVQNCTISGNVASNGVGGGVGLDFGGTVQNCTIVGNSAYFGGGVFIHSGTVRDCTISSNVAYGESADGGGMFITSGSVVQNCTISDNECRMRGGGVYISQSTLQNCTIYGNLAQDNSGGGVHNFGGIVRNCTLVGNNTRDGVFGGGGIFNIDGWVENCIVYFNRSAVWGDDNYVGDGTVTNVCAPDVGSAGNITNDPQFVSNGSGYGSSHVAGNYRLQSNSPCINAGTNQTWMTNAFDLDGNSRILFGIVDMGAYEATQAPRVSTPTGVAAGDGTYSNKVQVTWSAATNATGYTVWRATVNDTNGAAFLADSQAAAYDDMAVTNGALYYYWIQATNAAGSSGFSGADSGYAADAAATNTGAPPAAPRGVMASDGTYAYKVAVSWSAISNADGYQVWRHTHTNSSSAGLVASNLTGAGYDDTSVVVGTTYYYWVIAGNMSGTSGFGSADSGYAAAAGEPAPAVPGAPTGVSASDGTFTDRVVVTWAPITSATGYQVWRAVGVASAKDAERIGATFASAYTDTSASAGTLYFYWIAATNVSGVGAFSNPDNGYRATKVGAIHALTSDFDGDRYDDFALYTTASGQWYLKLSGNQYAVVPYPTGFGGDAYTPLADDFDGDGCADFTIYNAAAGRWVFMLSGSGYQLSVLDAFGGTNETALSGDFDGDSKAEPVLYQESAGNWRLLISSRKYIEIEFPSAFGGDGYDALAGDFDGDGRADFLVYGTIGGAWFIKPSRHGYTTYDLNGTLGGVFGGNGATPLAGDYDGDGKADFGVYQSGQWALRLSRYGYAAYTLTFGVE